jgi:hypothetical protein
MHRRPRLARWTNVGTKFVRRFDQSVRPVILDASGLGLLTVGGFTVSTTVGYVVAGIACFALQWRLRDGRSS